MTKVYELDYRISHDHLVEAIGRYLRDNNVYWPLPDDASIINIDLGMPLEEDEQSYNLTVSFDRDGEEFGFAEE